MDMTRNEVKRKQLVQAIDCLTPRMQAAVLALDQAAQEDCEEIRLRAGQPIRIQRSGSEQVIPSASLTSEELREVVSRAARYSVHSYGEALAQGYLPLDGGHRLGLCGSAVVKEGEITGLRIFSSLNLRVARQQEGVCRELVPQIRSENRTYSTLILSPPGFGKTTALRDLIRSLSELGVRVAVADERGELAAMRDGMPQFDVGPQTDVLEGCPKAQGVMLLLKTMAPDVIALDEITSPQDVDAIDFAGHCGVSILASAHAYGADDLYRRPLYRRLTELQIFERIICITRQGQRRIYQVQEMGGAQHA